MEQNRSLQDCYFFYYSTCRKGNSCTFRHEPMALGHEEACKAYLEGKCLNRQCTMRHMKIQKPRSATPCYWEDQPGGCRKPHCVFQHRQPRLNLGPPGQVVPTSNTALQMNPAAGGLILLPRIL